MIRLIKDWGLAAVLTVGLGLLILFFLSDRGEAYLMPGQTTHGHHQIELACTACHTDDMGGVKQDSCNNCHAEELKRVSDSHPVVKFKDPRNAERLEALDARYCISCHKEHQAEQTNEMGLTLPQDYCYHCHQDIGSERPSHEGMEFNSCATAGCHNFHDNSALYEKFIATHLDEPDFRENAFQLARDYYQKHYQGHKGVALTKEDADMPDTIGYTREHLNNWANTSHAAAGVNCTDCHNVKDAETGVVAWVDKPDHNSCVDCHGNETKGFLEGKHGMRLKEGLSPMTPAMAKIPMHAEAGHKELNCVSCHSSHRFDTQHAAVNACVSCHNDEHTQNYFGSKHYLNWVMEERGQVKAGQGVSCATCHMPRVERTEHGETIVMVDHNQNNSLRPNEKMIRSSCIHCHGLEFTMDALADEALIERNFQGLPSVKVESADLVREEIRKEAERRAASGHKVDPTFN